MFRCKYCDSKLILEGLTDYYCEECDLFFSENELIQSRKELIHTPEISKDPYFFQYVTTKDLLNCHTIELLNYLSLARSTQRKLKQKAYYNPKEVYQLDKDNLCIAKKAIHKIETILLERNGYFPASVFKTSIKKEYKRVCELQRVFYRKER